MHFVRLYTKLATEGPETSTQTEVARSEPNAMPPKVEYEVSAEYEVTKVQVVSGFGNVDCVLTVVDHSAEPTDA
jgi:hypothetical protein